MTDIRRKYPLLLIVCLCCLTAGFLPGRRINVHLVGDSTMADKSPIDDPEHGWGQMFPLFFSRNVNILNHAVNGRSTKSYLAEGKWQKVYDQLGPGDYVFIQFGHNDAKVEDTTRDNTHFTRAGAVTMASLVVEGIKELGLPLENELVQPATGDLPGTGKVVGLDYFFNNEWRMRKDSTLERYHYVWEDTTNSGFSLLGRSIDLLGGDLDTLQSAPTDSVLNRFSIYVLVDPDTPNETKAPHYMSDEAINVIVPWVERGGVLLLMENDSGNAEFVHFNKMAERFGIHFNENSFHKVYGKAYETGRNENLPGHPIFNGVRQIFMKEICSLTLQKPAEPVLTENGMVWMASAKFGKGLVFAAGDPWLYNEYMDTRRLPAEYENAKAGTNLFRWLLENAPRVK